jgi:hypothetical protein
MAAVARACLGCRQEEALMLTRLRACLLLAIVAAGCGGPLPVATLEEGVTIGGSVVCARTFDGFPAYGWGNCKDPGSGNVFTDNGIDTLSYNPGGWFQSEGGSGYQCVELATRYFFGAHGITGWHGFGQAKQMCSSSVWAPGVSATSSPVAGDLMIFPANTCGTQGAGHVAVVDGVSGNTIATTQKNWAMNVSYARSCASCFLTAREQCGGRLCPYGEWCGSGGRCCSGCGAGCPC